MLAFWLQLRRRRCEARKAFPVNAGRERFALRCVLPRGHDVTGRTAFDRQHRAPLGSDVKFWP